MKMYSNSRKEYNKVIFDSSNLPKSYGIESGKYKIEIVGQGQYQITPLQNVTKKTISKIEELIDSLCYAAHGYTDCKIPIKKYNTLINCFTDPVSSEKMIDLKFPPNLTLKF